MAPARFGFQSQFAALVSAICPLKLSLVPLTAVGMLVSLSQSSVLTMPMAFVLRCPRVALRFARSLVDDAVDQGMDWHVCTLEDPSLRR